MSFFKGEHKKLAMTTSFSNLRQAYALSEQRLRAAASSGDMQALRNAMAEHSAYEYALLYKSTPKCKERMKGGKRK